jgi:hypothetical protein
MLDRLKTVTYFVFAFSLLLTSSSALHLFGVPPVYYLVFTIGFLAGGWTVTVFFQRYILARILASDEAEGWEESEHESIVLFKLQRYPGFPEVKQCCYVVWRNAGKVEFLKDIDLTSKTTEFSTEEAEAMKFPSFEQAQSIADFAWFLNGCSYEFNLEMWFLPELEESYEPEIMD